MPLVFAEARLDQVCHASADFDMLDRSVNKLKWQYEHSLHFFAH